MRSTLAFVALLIVALPAVQAADDAQSGPAIKSVGLANGTGTIPYQGMAQVTVTVGVGCAQALRTAAATANHTAFATVAGVSPPAWLTVTPATVTFDATKCVSAGNPAGSGYILGTGQLGLQVAPEAPGVIPQVVNLTATLADPQQTAGVVSDPPYPYTFNVSYHVNRTITPSLKFPYTMTGRTLNFTVTVTQTANAPGMVMVDNLRASVGSVSGISFAYYAPPSQTRTFTVTYRGPDTAWNQTTLSFHALSHYVFNATGVTGPTLLEENVQWVVTNGNPGGEPDSKPSPVGALPLMGILAAAAVVLRRRQA